MDKREYSRFKRCMEWYQVVPQFHIKMENAPDEAVRMLGFEGMLDTEKVQEAVRCLGGGIAAKQPEENPYIQAYMEYIRRVSAYVVKSNGRNRFADDRLFRFMDTTRNRCRVESRHLRAHNNIYYFPICFELSRGCRVQCKFCALAAEPFSENFAYTEENRALWRSVLRISKETLGDIVDTGVCYFATEPMDNPDYEKFMLDHREITGGVSQITTALAETYPDRLREWMRTLGEETMRNTAPLRFSIRSIPQFRRIMSLYSPEELVDVELLPNNPESMFYYSRSGRADSQNVATEKCLNYSICCVSGFVVNMVDRSVQFIEPEMPNAQYPKGYRVRAKRTFTDARSYAAILHELLQAYAVGVLWADRPLCFNRNIRIEEKGGEVWFYGDETYFRLPLREETRHAISGIRKGATFNAIAAELKLERSCAERLYGELNNLFIRGYIRII